MLNASVFVLRLIMHGYVEYIRCEFYFLKVWYIPHKYEFTCNNNYIALDIFKDVNAFNKKNICDPSNTKIPTKIPFTEIEGV